MAFPSVTYTFANSTTADASQVNQNFTDVINGVSDGTKDVSVNALTVAGTATLNGAINLGNASSDDITITGSLASSVPLKTTNSFNIGSATLGLGILYLGNGSNNATVALRGGLTSSSYTLTLPITGGTSGQTAITNGSGTLSFRYIEKTTAQTTTYTGTGDETVILCDASSAAFTVNLPAAASFVGKHFFVKKTDSTLNAVTIDGNASETIDGATTTTLNTQNESIKIVSDGSNWAMVSRTVPTVSMSLTATGDFSTNSTYTCIVTRHGAFANVQIKIALAGAPNSTTLAVVNLPTGIVIDTAKLPGTTGTNEKGIGFGETQSAGNQYPIAVSFRSTSAIRPWALLASGTYASYAAITQAIPATYASGDYIYMNCTIPIVGWNA